MPKLSNKVAVVTGGSSGIGLAAAKELLAEGAKVVITGRNQAALDAAVRELNSPNVFAVQSDTSSLKDLEKLYQTVSHQFGKIDVLFVNAGIAKLAPIEYIDETTFDEVMDINFKGAFFALQKALPHFNTTASVVLLSSVNASAAMPNTSVYGASKAAMNSMGRIAAYELAPRGIRVNMVSPGPVSTPLFGKVGLSETQIQGFATAMGDYLPVKRFGQPEEIGKLVTYLASDDSAYVTGADFVIDGGFLLNRAIG